MPTTCIKCGRVSNHSLCLDCADELLNSYSWEDRIAYAELGVLVMRDKELGIQREKGYYARKLKELKEKSCNNLTMFPSGARRRYTCRESLLGR